jgi:hypothetical protein
MAFLAARAAGWLIALTDELDRRRTALIPDLGNYFFKPLKMFFYFYRIRLAPNCMQKNGVDGE